MLTAPTVSIVIPTKSRRELLEQTLESLRAQTFAGWEAIVIDDHSDDGTVELLQSVSASDQRFRFLQADEQQRGAPAARNLGARESRGRYVVFLDSDDLLAPHCLEQRVGFMDEHPELDFCVSPCGLFHDVPGDASLRWNVDDGRDDLDRLLAGDVPWQTSGPTWRRESLSKFGPWDETVLAGQDWEFHIRALCAGLRYERLDRIDFYWRMPGERSSISNQSLQSDRVRARPALLRKLLEAVRRAGKLTDSRRLCFAGLFWSCAKQTAEKVSRKDSRLVWRIALDEGLVDRRTWTLGHRYLVAWKLPALQRRFARKIERSWPVEMLGRRSPTFLKAPIDPGRPPTVSVLMSVYNSARYLSQALESIQRQTFRDFEFIIIDDGSTDASREIIERYAASDARIRLSSRPNTGLTRALNEGLAQCRGQFVARMDGDDIALPTRFARQVEYLREHPDCVCVGSRVLYINPFGLPTSGSESSSTSDHATDHDDIDRRLLEGKGGSLVHPATMMRREALLRIGGYREQFNNSEDLDLFLRLAEIGRLANLPEVLLHYRRHLESVSHQRYENQWRLKRQIVAEAYQRRGMTMPTDWTFTPWQPKAKGPQLREWGWFALRAGKRQAARALAWDAMKHEPLSPRSWKLLLCAWRGR